MSTEQRETLKQSYWRIDSPQQRDSHRAKKRLMKRDKSTDGFAQKDRCKRSKPLVRIGVCISAFVSKVLCLQNKAFFQAKEKSRERKTPNQRQLMR